MNTYIHTYFHYQVYDEWKKKDKAKLNKKIFHISIYLLKKSLKISFTYNENIREDS